MDFFQKCSAIVNGAGLWENESRGNLTFMSQDKIERKQRKAERVAEKQRKMKELQEAKADVPIEKPSGPIPTVATLPLDISFVVPSVPGPDLPPSQAMTCLRAIVEGMEDEAAEETPQDEEGAAKPYTTKKVASLIAREQQPEESPELPIWSDDDTRSCPESTMPGISEESCVTKESKPVRMMLVCVAGPHGSLPVAVPKKVEPGVLVRVRLGPQVAFRAVVPTGIKEGEAMALELPTGERMQVFVPTGKTEGDSFDISPPVIMVQVPSGATAGDVVEFEDHEGKKRTASVPQTGIRGQYFEVPLVQPDFL